MNFQFKTLLYMLVLSTFLLTSIARAEAWEVRLGLAPVFGTEFSSDLKQGLGAHAYLDVGLNDYISIELAGSYINHFIGEGIAYSLFNVGAGATLNLDVIAFGVGLAWIPFASVRLGFLQSGTDNSVLESGMGATVALGIDYIFDESFSLGLAFEYHGLLTNMDGLPAYLGINFRLGYRWLEF